MNTNYVLALDLGTTNCKAILLTDKGSLAGKVAQEYPLSMPQSGWAEQNPEDWWKAIAETVRKLVAKIDAGRIRCIGLSGQMHGLVLLDRKQRILRPAILWNDQRSFLQCEEIYTAAGGHDGLLSFTNNSMIPGYTGGKILWVRRHEPEVYRQTALFLMPKDYLRMRLCGSIGTDLSDASGTGLFDVKQKRWSGELASRLEIPESMLPPVCPSQEIAGTLSHESALALGLPSGIPVIAGGGDAVMQAFGSGLTDQKTVMIVIGTGGNVTMSQPRCPCNPDGTLQVFCHVLPDQWVSMGVTLTAGSSLKWFRDSLGSLESIVAKDCGDDPYDLLGKLAASSRIGAGGLLFLPYLQGERCPHVDVQLRGAFLGLGLNTRKADLVRSIMEGVAYSLRDVLDLIIRTGAEPEEIVVSGGGASSSVWRRIMADVTGRVVVTKEGSEDASAMGAAFLAGIPAGFWTSAQETASLLHRKTEDLPIEGNVATYDAIYGLYLKQYDRLKSSYEELAALRTKI